MRQARAAGGRPPSFSIMSRIRRRRLLLPPLLLLLLLVLQPTYGFVPAVRTRASTVSMALGGSSSRSSTAAGSTTAAPAPPDAPFRTPEEVPVWQVPPSIRREAHGASSPPATRIEFLSLETLFPGPDGQRLAEAFDGDARFRSVCACVRRYVVYGDPVNQGSIQHINTRFPHTHPPAPTPTQPRPPRGHA